MLVLIFFSALFSGSEAALFSLQQRARRRLARSGVGGKLAAGLLKEPERLLSAILFWNLLINMIYFAITAIVGGRLDADPAAGTSATFVFTIVSLVTIIFFSEMLPKSLAVMAPIRFAIFVGVPLALAVRIVDPILPAMRTMNLLARRLVGPSFEPEPEIDLADIERAIEFGTHDAALIQREQDAMKGVVEMASTRVSEGELMRPRAKLRFSPTPLGRDVLSRGTPPGGYLLVTDSAGKHISGAIAVHRLRPSQIDDLNAAIESVIYVPWSARVSQVWDQLNDEDCSVAVVVNEFGEAIGALSEDDILRRVLQEPIKRVKAERYRVRGSESLPLLAKRLGVELPEEGVSTVAGYIQRYNERRPRVGDTAVLDRFELCVVEVGETISWIDVYLLPDETADMEKGSI